MKYTIIVTTLAFIISCSSLPLISKSWGMKENTNICFFNTKGNPICEKKLNGTILCGKTEVGQEICVDMTPATMY
tara:strand:+ start:157 stop:381 length:225 start_codon:yes stop_codon:yes gene_type:complete